MQTQEATWERRLLLAQLVVQIRFTSTLTAEDENRIAPVVLSGVARLLELLPIAYVLQIETTDGQVYRSTALAKDHPPEGEAVRVNRRA